MCRLLYVYVPLFSLVLLFTLSLVPLFPLCPRSFNGIPRRHKLPSPAGLRNFFWSAVGGDFLVWHEVIGWRSLSLVLYMFIPCHPIFPRPPPPAFRFPLLSCLSPPTAFIPPRGANKKIIAHNYIYTAKTGKINPRFYLPGSQSHA